MIRNCSVQPNFEVDKTWLDQLQRQPTEAEVLDHVMGTSKAYDSYYTDFAKPDQLPLSGAKVDNILKK